MRSLFLVIYSFLFIQNEVVATNLQSFEPDVERSLPKQALDCSEVNSSESSILAESLLSTSLSPVADVKLEKEVRKSLSFSGGSYFSATYNMGFLKALQYFLKLEDGEDIVYLGDSSGCLVALVAAIGIDADFGIEFLLKSLREKRDLPHSGFSQWGRVLKENLSAASVEFNSKLGKEAHEHVNGKLHISVTHFQFSLFPLRNELVSFFHSTEDLIETILTSCHVPWVLGDTFFTKWRGKTCVDGGITNHNPALDENTVRLNPFLWRSPFFLIRHGCYTLHTEEEALSAISWGYEDARKNIQYFLDRGFKLKDPSLALQLNESFPCVEDNDGPTVIGVLRKKINTVYFYVGNIVLSQACSYLSLAKSSVKALAWSIISIPVKVASVPIKLVCLPFKVLSFFCRR